MGTLWYHDHRRDFTAQNVYAGLAGGYLPFDADRPAQLKEYGEMHGIKAGWTLLTGKADDCELLRRRLGFADPDPARDKDVTNHIGPDSGSSVKRSRTSAAKPSMDRRRSVAAVAR